MRRRSLPTVRTHGFAVDVDVGDVGVEDGRVVRGDEPIVFEGEEQARLAAHAVADDDELLALAHAGLRFRCHLEAQRDEFAQVELLLVVASGVVLTEENRWHRAR